MTTELSLLAWTLVLAIVQILLTASFATKDVGLPYNASPRDVPPTSPYGKITKRLHRAQNNLMETLPLFAAAVLIAHVMQRESAHTLLGAQLYFWARVIYVPIYACGIAYVRTALWTVSLVGLLMIVCAVL